MRSILYLLLLWSISFTVFSQSAVVQGGTSVTYAAGGTGSVQRDLGSKLFDYVTPFDYGATGDTAVDDTQALQRAIDAAQAQNRALHLLGAQYKTTRPLFFFPDSGKTFMLIGSGAVLYLKSDGLLVDTTQAKIRRCGNVVIEGIGFRAPAYGIHYDTQKYIKAIFVQNLERIEVRRCTFRNIYGNGIHVKGYCKSGIIDGNLLESVFGKTAVPIPSGKTTIVDNYGDGISLEDRISNVTVSNNVLILSGNELGRCGIAVDYSSRNISVDNNTIYGYDRSIHIETSTSVTVRGNKSYKSACGLYIALSKNIIASDNFIDGKSPLNSPTISEPGLLYVYKSDSVRIAGNFIQNWTNLATRTFAAKVWGSNVTFESNVIEHGPVFGYGGTNNRNRFVGNLFNDADLDISYTKEASVERNRFHTAKLITSYTENATVTGNDFVPHPDSTYADKVIVYGSKGLIFSGNRIASVQDYLVDDYQNTSYTFGHNMLFRKKSTDGSRIFRYGNSSRNPLMFTAYPDLLKDEVTGSTRPLGTYVDSDTTVSRQFATKSITKRAVVSATTSATVDVVISLGTTFPVVHSILPTWTPASQSLNTTEVVPQVVGTHVDASGRVYEVKVRLTRSTGTTTNGTVSITVTGTE